MRNSLLAVASVALVAVEAREVATLDGRLTRQTVGLGADEPLCFFENANDRWCLVGTPPIAKVGWEWEQTYTTETQNGTEIEYYQVQFIPYVEAQANIMSDLTLQALYINQLTMDIEKFKLNYFMSLIFTNDYYICFGAGQQAQEIKILVEMAQKFWNCSKTIVDDLADFSATWTGADAKYFENCSQSGNSKITMIDKSLQKEIDQTDTGTTNPFSQQCTNWSG